MANEKTLAPGDKAVRVTDKVKFTAKYPADYKKKKYMVDGKTYELHPLHAERLEKKKLGSIQPK